MQTVYDRNGAWLAAIQAGYLLGSRTVITATGANTYTPPVRCRAVLAECFGGGGGGATTVNSSAGQATVGAAGCGGAYAASLFLVSNTAYTVNVGVGGAAATSGGTTSVVRGGVTFVSSAGAIPGTNLLGTNTTEGFIFTSVSTTGTGDVGASGNIGLPAHRLSGSQAISSKGGAGRYGGSPVQNVGHVATATAGNLYGGGGNGGVSINAAGASTGGAGGQGAAILWEFY